VIEHVAADVAIVGGGTAGCSTALHLRWRGATVVLLERGSCGGQASGVNYGGVRQQGRDLAELPLARRSREMWSRLAAIVGSDCEFVASGHVKLARSDADIAELEAYREAVRPYGLELELLGRNDLRARYPFLGAAAVGSSAPDGAATRLTRRPCPRRPGGADIREHAPVTMLAHDGARFRLRTEDGI
jgi:sarcosine oxidase subunit beta